MPICGMSVLPFHSHQHYQIDNELMHHINIHGNSHYWFGKCISIKSVRVTILLWPIPSLLMQRSGHVCFDMRGKCRPTQ
jgi:hypothetical protein